jgi:hypothetical protein
MLDIPCSDVVWRVLATHSIRQFPLHFPPCASPCAITFQLVSTTFHACSRRRSSVCRSVPTSCTMQHHGRRMEGLACKTLDRRCALYSIAYLHWGHNMRLGWRGEGGGENTDSHQSCVIPWCIGRKSSRLQLNLVKPTGNVMHEQVYTFNVFYIMPHYIGLICIYLRTNSDFCPITQQASSNAWGSFSPQIVWSVPEAATTVLCTPDDQIGHVRRSLLPR